MLPGREPEGDGVPALKDTQFGSPPPPEGGVRNPSLPAMPKSLKKSAKGFNFASDFLNSWVNDQLSWENSVNGSNYNPDLT